MIAYLTSSKTLLMWLAIFGIAGVAIIFATFVRIIWNSDVPYLNDFLNLLGIGGGGSTVRNVVSDGIMPRVPMAIGAAHDPSIATQAPTSMKLSTASATVDGSASAVQEQPATGYVSSVVPP